MSERDTCYAALLESLRAEAVRKFGPARAEALFPMLEVTAGQLADVALYSLDREEGPAFYTGPGDR